MGGVNTDNEYRDSNSGGVGEHIDNEITESNGYCKVCRRRKEFNNYGAHLTYNLQRRVYLQLVSNLLHTSVNLYIQLVWPNPQKS